MSEVLPPSVSKPPLAQSNTSKLPKLVPALLQEFPLDLRKANSVKGLMKPKLLFQKNLMKQDLKVN
jgi:hypothetical protein